MKKRIIACLMAVVMLIPVCFVSVNAEEATTSVLTECSGNCDVTPTIIVHGLGQSTVAKIDDDGNYIYDENGELEEVWPLSVDAMPLVKKLLWPIIKTLFTQKDYLSEPLGEAVLDVFKYNICDEEGKENENVSVVKYVKSVAACTEEEKDELYDIVPLRNYCELAGTTEDHLYYFMYNSFGNSCEIAEEFIEYVRMVKAETGHDKVNIVPISLGGTVMNAAMEYYRDELAGSVDKIVYIVPATNGSKLISDLYQHKFCTDDESLYLTMFPNLIEGWTGYLVNIAVRILKNDVLVSILNNTIDTLVDGFLDKCTNMWALTSYEDWDAIMACHPDFAEKYPVIYEQIVKYHEAQGNRDANLQYLIDNGTKVYDIVDTDYPLYCIVPSWTEYNADGIIQIDSTSLGCVSCPVGDTLDEADYEGKTQVCTDETHNHINQANTVDASYGFAPETTWYLYGQDHEGTARDDIILNLAMDILAGNVEDIYSNPEYPQFMYGRETKKMRNRLKDFENMKANGSLSDEQIAIIQPAADLCYALLANNLATTEEAENADNALIDALVKAGLMEADETSAFEVWAEDFFKKQSERLYEKYGNRGFCELLRK